MRGSPRVASAPCCLPSLTACPVVSPVGNAHPTTLLHPIFPHLQYEAYSQAVEAQIEVSIRYGQPPIGASVIGAAVHNIALLAAGAALYDLDSPGVPAFVASTAGRGTAVIARPDAWTNLKEVLKAMRDGSDLFPPLKAALVGVTLVMDSIDRVGDVNDEFVRITSNVKGFQGIFSQYASEQEISPAMRSRLDAVISSVVAALSSTAALLNLALRELNLIKGAIDSKTERGRARRTLEAAGDVDKVVIAFNRLGEVIDRFQLNMGLSTEHGVESIAVNTVPLTSFSGFGKTRLRCRGRH
ncbi:hypothetical protein B0H14DRAFT_3718345 [Mycena olivaceomarginata]|nr:hypothetical protein B0H14DRAFT_3718345 [Mycena olivaceomarginata]